MRRALVIALAALAAQALAAAAPAGAAYPGRNGLIYFTSPSQPDEPPSCGVATVAPNGRGYDCIDPGGFDPAVSPDHRLIAKVIDTTPLQLVSETLKGRHGRRLTHTQVGDNGDPFFSRDGRRILSDVSGGGASSGIYVMNADGSGRRQLTTGGIRPAFSPSGAQIAYQAGGIAIANADGTGSHVVIADSDVSTDHPAAPGKTEHDRTLTTNSQPDFSPDGHRLVFVRQVLTDVSTCDDATFDCTDKTSTAKHVWIANADGSGVRQLTTSASLAESEPSWSPNGRQIAFYAQPTHAFLDGAGDIWVVGADGRGRHVIAHGQFPYWSTVRGSVPARPRIKLTLVQFRPGRCLNFFTDGYGASVTTRATKATGFDITIYIDRQMTDEVSNARDLSTGPHAVRRGRHRLRVVVTDEAIHDTVSRTISFREC